MMAILKWQTHVSIIMSNIVFVMHHKEFPKRHINHGAMFGIMLEQQRKSQQLMTLCRSDQVTSQYSDDDFSLHKTNIQDSEET